MATGLQQNNYSPMGQGQPQQNKDGKKANFMQDVVGYRDTMFEGVAPGIPAAQMGASLHNTSQLDKNTKLQQTLANPQTANIPGIQTNNASNTPVGIPRGWRGLDLTPVAQPQSVNPLHGFNLDRAYAAGDPNSVKDTFARWASGIQAPLAGLDKAGVGNLINQNLDRAKHMGLNITGVQGDKIQIDAKEHGPMWVDVVESAGGANPAWAWQLEGQPTGLPTTAPATNIYNQAQQQLMLQPQETPETELERMIALLMSQEI